MFVDRMQVLINMTKFTTAAVGITLLVTGGGVLFRDLKNNTPPPVTVCQGLWSRGTRSTHIVKAARASAATGRTLATVPITQK